MQRFDVGSPQKMRWIWYIQKYSKMPAVQRMLVSGSEPSGVASDSSQVQDVQVGFGMWNQNLQKPYKENKKKWLQKCEMWFLCHRALNRTPWTSLNHVNHVNHVNGLNSCSTIDHSKPMSTMVRWFDALSSKRWAKVSEHNTRSTWR